MAMRRVSSALLIVVILKIAFSTSEETCKKNDTCSCTLSNGGTVNLKKVDGTPTKPRFVVKGDDEQQGRTMNWNPCTPFSKEKCSKVLVCQLGQGESYPAGTKDTSFSVNNDGNVVISYGGIASGSPVHTRGTEVTLKCDSKQPGDGATSAYSETKPSTSSSIYKFTFTSKHACPSGGSSSSGSGGLSVGSILLIIFFPLLLMYIIIGVLINRYGRGIQSMPEVLPNHSFWADFPFLVKDGVVFTCGCIKGACSSLYQKCNKHGYAKI